VPALAPLIEDFLVGLGAASRSQHTLAGYRGDLLGVGGRSAAQLHGPDASAAQLDVAELDQRAMRRGFAAWASDHSEGSLLRAWGVWNRFFTFLVGDEVLLRNPMSAVPKPKLPQTAPRSIRHENPAELLLRIAATPDSNAKASKRWPERDIALLATFCVTGIRLAQASAGPGAGPERGWGGSRRGGRLGAGARAGAGAGTPEPVRPPAPATAARGRECSGAPSDAIPLLARDPVIRTRCGPSRALSFAACTSSSTGRRLARCS